MKGRQAGNANVVDDSSIPAAYALQRRHQQLKSTTAALGAVQ
jgi:hypothetical protein